MRINKTKLKKTNLFILSIGEEITNETEFMQAVKFCIKKVKMGQATRTENTINEHWGINDLERLINCIDYKELNNEK